MILRAETTVATAAGMGRIHMNYQRLDRVIVYLLSGLMKKLLLLM